MSDLEERLQLVRSRQQEATRRRAQAEAKLDTVRAQREDVLARLKAMNYDTVEAAQQRAVALKAETESVLADIEAKVRGL